MARSLMLEKAGQFIATASGWVAQRRKNACSSAGSKSKYSQAKRNSPPGRRQRSTSWKAARRSASVK